MNGFGGLRNIGREREGEHKNERKKERIRGTRKGGEGIISNKAILGFQIFKTPPSSPKKRSQGLTVYMCCIIKMTTLGACGFCYSIGSYLRLVEPKPELSCLVDENDEPDDPDDLVVGPPPHPELPSPLLFQLFPQPLP